MVATQIRRHTLIRLQPSAVSRGVYVPTMETSACSSGLLPTFRPTAGCLRQTTEDAVLNANYIRKGLEGTYDLPYSTPTMHEVVFSDKLQAKKGVRTMDIAKRLIDYGFHPYTTPFR